MFVVIVYLLILCFYWISWYFLAEKNIVIFNKWELIEAQIIIINNYISIANPCIVLVKVHSHKQLKLFLPKNLKWIVSKYIYISVLAPSKSSILLISFFHHWRSLNKTKKYFPSNIYFAKYYYLWKQNEVPPYSLFWETETYCISLRKTNWWSEATKMAVYCNSSVLSLTKFISSSNPMC